MTKPANNVRIWASALAPFGRIGRALGFRWVFPIGTLPIPFHPLILWGMLLGIPLLIGWEIVSTIIGVADKGGPRWLVPLFGAIVLGVLMSIPIISWAMMVFAGPLLQSMLITGSLLLLVADIAVGRADARLVILPAGFILLYLVQAIGGRWQLAGLKKRARRWQRVDPGEKQVLVERDYGFNSVDLMTACAIDRLAVDPPGQHRGETFHWVGAAAIDEILGASRPKVPEAWRLSENIKVPIVVEPRVDRAFPTLSWTKIKFRSPLWLVTGDLTEIRIEGDGIDQRLVVGQAQVINWLPLFVLFHWTAIFGGKSEGLVGFVRARAIQIGPQRNGAVDTSPSQASFALRPETQLTPYPQDVLRRLEQATDNERDIAARFYAALETNPRLISDASHLNPVRSVEATPLLMNGHGEKIVRALVYAKDNRLRVGVYRASVMLEHLTDQEWHACKAPIMKALSSRMLACAWPVRPGMDVGDIPKGTPRNSKEAGYALMRERKHLFERLKHYGPEGEQLYDRIETAVKKAASHGRAESGQS